MSQENKKHINIRVDQSKMNTSYVNAFQPIANPEEFMVDLGTNQAVPNSQNPNTKEMHFKVENRLVMNYTTAKRLAATLSQVIKTYEEKYGNITPVKPISQEN